jgi:hypothetical protein
MPFCPKCKYEYVQGTAYCPDCEQTLVAQLPTEAGAADAPVSSEQWDGERADVFWTMDELEASIIRGVLQSSGIPVVFRRNPSTTYPTKGMWGGFILSVPAALATEATEAVRIALEDGKRLDIEQPWDDCNIQIEEA